jgi:hypothetical protein
MSNKYPDDDPLAAIYIESFDGAMPKSTVACAPSHPRLWELSAQAAGVVAVVRAILAEQAAATASQTQTP